MNAVVHEIIRTRCPRVAPWTLVNSPKERIGGSLGGTTNALRPSRVLKAPASDLSRRQEALRSLLRGELEMRFGGNPIEGSNPSLSATPSLKDAAY